MTQEFLRTLEKELRHLTPSERNDILNEYRIHIDEALKNGESEAEILKELGNPTEVAEEILKIEAQTPPVEPVNMKAGMSQEFKPEHINMIDLNAESLNVTIQYSHEFDMRFYSPSDTGIFEYSVINDVLKINHEDKEERAGVGSLVNLIKTSGGRRKDTLIIYWPETLETLNVKTSRGTVVVDGISSKHFYLNTDMGAVTGKHLIGVKSVFYTNMGAVSVADSTFDSLEMESKMGKVTIKNVDAHLYHLHTDMGKVDAFDLKPDSNIKAKSNMGAINACFKAEPLRTKIITKTDLGKIQNELKHTVVNNPEYTAEFTTDMGAVKISSI